MSNVLTEMSPGFKNPEDILIIHGCSLFKKETSEKTDCQASVTFICLHSNFFSENLAKYRVTPLIVGMLPPSGINTLSISCSFWEILVKSCVHPHPHNPPSPPAGHAPLRGNPGSATANCD